MYSCITVDRLLPSLVLLYLYLNGDDGREVFVSNFHGFGCSLGQGLVSGQHNSNNLTKTDDLPICKNRLISSNSCKGQKVVRSTTQHLKVHSWMLMVRNWHTYTGKCLHEYTVGSTCLLLHCNYSVYTLLQVHAHTVQVRMGPIVKNGLSILLYSACCCPYSWRLFPVINRSFSLFLHCRVIIHVHVLIYRLC